MSYRRIYPFLLLAVSLNASAFEKDTIRIGAMASGTLAWELQAMKDQGLLDNAGFDLKITPLANQQAGKVALQANSVDMIISDWIWVSSMRSEGIPFTFTPYSNSAGGLLVAANSDIKTLQDLKAKKLGIAGGELDKNWLLLQALGSQQGLDLGQSVEKVYGAPPLLEQQLKAGRIDAILTYWQFAARLETEGYRQLMSGEDIIRQLGIGESVPSLGYVFRQNWADQHKASLQGFLQLAAKARNTLCSDNEAWQKVVYLTESNEPATQKKIHERYCEGRVANWSAKNQAAAKQIYNWLNTISQNKLGGKSTELEAGSFWSAE